MIALQIEEVWTGSLGYLSIAYQKNSPYGVFMKQVIKEVIERGQLSLIKNRWAARQNCNGNSVKKKALSLEKCVSMFTIMLCGLALAILVLVFEKIWCIFNGDARSKNEFSKKDAMTVELKNHLQVLQYTLTYGNIPQLKKERLNKIILEVLKDC